jgi:hypothetical protein
MSVMAGSKPRRGAGGGGALFRLRGRVPLPMSQAIERLARAHRRSMNNEMLEAVLALEAKPAAFHATPYAIESTSDAKSYDVRIEQADAALVPRVQALLNYYPSQNALVLRALGLWLEEQEPV